MTYSEFFYVHHHNVINKPHTNISFEKIFLLQWHFYNITNMWYLSVSQE